MKRLIAITVGIAVAAAVTLAILLRNPLRSLLTFRQVDDHPLYVMHLYGDYHFDDLLKTGTHPDAALPLGPLPIARSWACTCFSAFGQPGQAILGRNFDWYNHPALLLFTHPSHGYDSVSMVDISYLVGLDSDEPSWSDRLSLLDAPYLPFDGMNERGLAVGMMAVPDAQVTTDRSKVTIDSLAAIRLLLDKAQSVDEALPLLGAYNIDWGSGPPLHYLIADSRGNSAVVEFVDGEMKVLRNERPWQAATNFVLSGHSPESAMLQCNRYATAYRTLEQAQGQASHEGAMALLEDVSQPSTIWSVVYDMQSGQIAVAMGRDYGQAHHFKLSMKQE
ncbi:MAG: linear amide C-N hydrolase [Anaerolineae bacterium]|nr:linear amide C-N hydrolase [Anaerolineae bacterium]